MQKLQKTRILFNQEINQGNFEQVFKRCVLVPIELVSIVFALRWYFPFDIYSGFPPFWAISIAVLTLYGVGRIMYPLGVTRMARVVVTKSELCYHSPRTKVHYLPHPKKETPSTIRRIPRKDILQVSLELFGTQLKIIYRNENKEFIQYIQCPMWDAEEEKTQLKKLYTILQKKRR